MNRLSQYLATTMTAVMLSGAGAANAATSFDIIDLKAGSTTFGATTNDVGAFTHTFDFTTVGDTKASGSLITMSLGGSQDIDFTSIDLDGIAYTLRSGDPTEAWGIDLADIGAGLHSITLHGTAAMSLGEYASYAGTLNVSSDTSTFSGTAFELIDLANGSDRFGATTSDSGDFVHTFDFTTVGDNLVSGSLVTISLEDQQDINFTSIDLDGVTYSLKAGDPLDAWGLSQTLLGAGAHTLTLKGTVIAGTTPRSASYSGTLNITDQIPTPIPEPGAWALMILGFGAAGIMLRRRRMALPA